MQGQSTTSTESASRLSSLTALLSMRNNRHHSHCYFVLQRGVKYCDEYVPLSVSVCFSVCLLTELENCTTKFHQIFCAWCLWPWLRPPLTVLKYAMYFRFCGWCCLHTTEAMGQNEAEHYTYKKFSWMSKQLVFVEFIRMWQWGKSLLPTFDLFHKYATCRMSLPSNCHKKNKNNTPTVNFCPI